MSFLTLFESDSKKSKKILNSTVITVVNLVSVPAGVSTVASATQLITIPDLLIENEKYLVFWRADISSVAGNNAINLAAIYDQAGQNAEVGF